MKQAPSHEYYTLGMDTEIAYRIFGGAPESIDADIRYLLNHVENLLSRYIPESEISLINRNAGARMVDVSQETLDVLLCACNISKLSKGLFDITIGPLVDVWDFKHATHVPSDTVINKTLGLINSDDLFINKRRNTVRLRKTHQSIDLGGIGKGYACDRCMQLLRIRGISSAFLCIGGNVSVMGNLPDGRPWNVGIRHPRKNDNVIASLSVTDTSVVTSGDYERYFTDGDGNRWHHIINPITGYPAHSDVISATVIHENSMLADALSTAFLVAGTEKSMRLMSKLPFMGAVLITDRLNVLVSRNLANSFQAMSDVEMQIF